MQSAKVNCGMKGLQDVDELRRLKQRIEALKREESQLQQAGTDAEQLQHVRAELKRVKHEHEDLEFRVLEMLVSDEVEEEECEDLEEEIVTPTNETKENNPYLSLATANVNRDTTSMQPEQYTSSPTAGSDKLDNGLVSSQTVLHPNETNHSNKVPQVFSFPHEDNRKETDHPSSGKMSHNADGLSSVEARPTIRLIERRDQPMESSRPLTQFLPTMDPNFALDEYLLSCGHNLEQMKHKILVSKHSCSGNLIWLTHKPSRLWLSPGKRHWVVFDRLAQTLYILRNAQNKKSKDLIPFNQIQDVFIDRSSPFSSISPKRTNNVTLVFCVQSISRVYHFLAPDEDTLRVWVQALFTGAEAYLSSVIVEHN